MDIKKTEAEGGEREVEGRVSLVGKKLTSDGG
jgi:hypothetical protein